MRKECLLLQSNQLVSLEGGGNIGDLELIIKLDLHSNKLTSLPEGLGCLKNLVDLNVSENSLKLLPASICELRCLQSLDASFNKLKCLPTNIGYLKNMRSLHVNGNPKLLALPNTLGLLTNLRDLRLDKETLEYPPAEVTANGPEAVLEFLSKDCDYTSPTFEPSNPNSIGINENLSKQCHIDFEVDDDIFQEKVRNLAREKDLRMKELAAIEKDLKDQQMKELDFQKQRKIEKDELLKNLLVQENCLQNKIVEFQAQKDAERKEVITHFQKVEEQSEKMLTELLAANRKMMDPVVLEERDRAQREEMLSLQTLDLRRKEVIDAMEKMVAEELEQTAKMMNYELNRDEEARDILTRVEEVQQRIGCAAQQQRDLAVSCSGLQWMREVQSRCGRRGTALGLLMQRTDAHSQALCSEIVLAERQLATLTSLELMRRRMDARQLTNELSSKRIQLSEILMDLLEQRDQRRQQLLDTLLAIQESQANCSEDVWLKQYQRLMDQCPRSLRETLDPLLVHCLVQLNAVHCLPYLSAGSVDSLDEIALEKMGASCSDKELILSALAMYREKQVNQYMPSAPELVQPNYQPSAPPILPTEDETAIDSDGCCCVVCMEGAYEVVFIPCGHLCVCVNCASSLRDCPLCRATVQQKIRAIVP